MQINPLLQSVKVLGHCYIETNNGIVTLTGIADTQAQADNAVQLAKRVAGVKSVTSSIQVSDKGSNQ